MDDFADKLKKAFENAAKPQTVEPGTEELFADSPRNALIDAVGGPAWLKNTNQESAEYWNTLPEQMAMMAMRGSLTTGTNVPGTQIVQGIQQKLAQGAKLSTAEEMLYRKVLGKLPPATKLSTDSAGRTLTGYASGGTVDWEDEPQNIQIPQVPQQATAQVPPMQSVEPLMQAQALQETGIRQEASAQQQAAGKEAGIQAKQAQDLLKVMADYQSHYDTLENERQNIVKDIEENKIDPNRYMKNLSTSGQVATNIGLLLGGIGSGLAGGENQALKILQNNIDRDISAQQAESNKKQNILASLEKQFGNRQDATNMARIITTEAYAAKLAKAAAQSKNPLAVARANQAIGQLRASTAPLLQSIAQRQAVMKGLQEGNLSPEMAVQAVVPEPHQKEVFNEIEKAQNAKVMENDAMHLFDKASKENTVWGRIKNKGDEPASLSTLRTLLIPLVKDAAGRVSDTELETIEHLMPSLKDSDAQAASKRKGLWDFMQAKKAAPVSKGFGIDLNKFQSTKSTPQFRVNPNAPQKK